MLIDTYSFGHLRVDEDEHTGDVIVGPQGVKGGWRRRQSHLLQSEDLEWALAIEPEVLVVGTGRFGLMRVSGATRKFLKERGIGLIAQGTGRAWPRAFRAVAAFHVFC